MKTALWNQDINGAVSYFAGMQFDPMIVDLILQGKISLE